MQLTTDVLVWELRFYDGDERDWRGYLGGKEVCRMHRGSWWVHDPDEGDSCSDEMEGIMNCSRVLRVPSLVDPREYYKKP
jgi:hypothetical protein